MDRQTLITVQRLGVRVAVTMFAAGMMLSAGPAGAVLYKWVDANGRVSYSDQPPPTNVKAEIVNGAPPASSDAVRELANQEADLKKRQAQRADDAKKADKARTDAAMQQQMCIEARGRMRIYATDQALSRINEKGEQVYMDETTRNKERERLEVMIRERCAG